MFCYFRILGKYAVFSGRAGRAEFWCGLVWSILLVFVAMFVEAGLGFFVGGRPGMIMAAAILFVMLPWWSLCVRRLHDMGFSGWHVFYPLSNLQMGFREGDAGDNAYGPPPGTA